MLPLSSERHRQEEFTLSLRWNKINITCHRRFLGPWHCPTWVLTPARLIMEEDLLHPIVSGCRWIAEDRWICYSYLMKRCMALCTLHLESRNSCDMWWHVQMHLVDQQPPQDLVVTGLHDLRAGTTVLQSLLHRRDLECVRSVFGSGCPRQSTSQTRAFWFHAKSTLGWDRLWNGWKKARRWGRARDWRSRGTTTRWASIKPKPKTVAGESKLHTPRPRPQSKQHWILW